MGNQLTYPSGTNWYLEDFNTLHLKNPVSIFDGTFNHSFKAENKNQEVVAIKAIQLYDKVSISIAQTYFNIFQDKCTLSSELTSGNLIATPYLSKTGAFLVRPFLDMPLLERIAIDPPLEVTEKKWIAFQLLRAVRNLHNIEIYHGDIKPENVIVLPDLRVYLTDHSPYKPQIIGPNQPHYFIHFFSYGRSDAYIAPERISNDFSAKPDMFAADLFSLGCLIAFIFTDGDSLFDFTSLVRYGSGDQSCISSIINKVNDDKMKSLILQLIDIDPKKRLMAFASAHMYFPDWISIYYDFSVINLYCDSNSVNKIPSNFETLEQVFPKDVSDELIIYITYVAELFSKELNLSNFTLLIDHYEHFVLKVKDDKLKIVRFLPPLIFLLERQSNVVSSLALESVIKIIRSVEKIDDSEPMHSFSSAYFVPQLVKTMNYKSTQNVIISRLPIILVEFSRLWPSILDEIPIQPSFFLPMLPSSVVSKQVDDTKILVVRSFLSNARSVAYTKNYKLFRALCFIVFQLLNCNSYIPLIIEFVTSFLRVLRHCDKILFYAEFYDPIQRALLSYVCDNSEDISFIFDAFTTMIKDGAIKNVHYSAIAKLIYNHICSRSPSVKSTARVLLKKIPHIYTNLGIISMISPQNTNTIVHIRSNTFAHKNERKLAGFDGASQKHANPIQPEIVKTHFITSSKICNDSIQKVIILNDQSNINLIVQHSNKNIIRFKVNLLPQSQQSQQQQQQLQQQQSQQSQQQQQQSIQTIPKFQTLVELSGTSPVVNIQHVGNHNGIIITRTNDVRFQRDENPDRIFYKSRNPFTNSALIGQKDIFLETYKESLILDFSVSSVKARFNFHGTMINKVDYWKNDDIFITAMKNGRLYVLDKRVQLPVISRKINEIQDLITLPNFSYAIVKKNKMSVYQLHNVNSPVFGVAGELDSLMPIDNKIIVLNQFGTFSVDYTANCFSLADKNKAKLLPLDLTDIYPLVNLPRVYSNSLHHHTFPLTSCCCTSTGTLCASSDVAGYVNIWSMKSEKAKPV